MRDGRASNVTVDRRRLACRAIETVLMVEMPFCSGGCGLSL